MAGESGVLSDIPGRLAATRLPCCPTEVAPVAFADVLRLEDADRETAKGRLDIGVSDLVVSVPGLGVVSSRAGVADAIAEAKSSGAPAAGSDSGSSENLA